MSNPTSSLETLLASIPIVEDHIRTFLPPADASFATLSITCQTLSREWFSKFTPAPDHPIAALEPAEQQAEILFGPDTSGAVKKAIAQRVFYRMISEHTGQDQVFLSPNTAKHTFILDTEAATLTVLTKWLTERFSPSSSMAPFLRMDTTNDHDPVFNELMTQVAPHFNNNREAFQEFFSGEYATLNEAVVQGFLDRTFAPVVASIQMMPERERDQVIEQLNRQIALIKKILYSFPASLFTFLQLEHPDIEQLQNLGPQLGQLSQLCWLKWERTHYQKWMQIQSLPEKTPAEVHAKQEMLLSIYEEFVQNNWDFPNANPGWLPLSGLGLRALPHPKVLISPSIRLDLGVQTIHRRQVEPNGAEIVHTEEKRNYFSSVPLHPRAATIRELVLTGNLLERFSHLPRYKQLGALHVDHTGLTSIPQEVLDLPSSCTQLDIGYNALITLPEELATFGGSNHREGSIYVNGNPLVYIPPELLVSNKLQWTSMNEGAPSEISYYIADALYTPTSKLGQFIRLFQRNEKSYDKAAIAKGLENLTQEDRNLIYEMVYCEAKEPTTLDPTSFGAQHALRDLSCLARATRRALLMKLERLPEADKNTRYGRLYNLAGKPQYVPFNWAELAAPHALSLLADALSLEEVSDTRPYAEHITALTSSFHELAKFLCNAQKLKKYPIEEKFKGARPEVQAFRIAEGRAQLSSQWHTCSRIVEEMERLGIPLPESLDTLRKRVSSEAPDFCRLSEEGIKADLKRAEEAARIIQEADYRGKDYNQELAMLYLNADGNELLYMLFGPYFTQTEFENKLSRSSDKVQNDLFVKVWALSSSSDKTLTPEQQISWGREHLFDDLRLLGVAAQECVLDRYRTLPEEEKNQVAGLIYALAGSPETSDPMWGEHHAEDSIIKLACALNRVDKNMRISSILSEIGRSTADDTGWDSGSDSGDD